MGALTTDTAALKKLMIDNGIKTTKELSERSGVNRNTLAQVVNGKIQPSADVMQKLVMCLNIEPQTAGCIFFKRNLRTA